MAIRLHTELCDTLGVEYPVFAFNHCRDVTAAVSNGGGIGVLGATGYSPEGILRLGQWLKKNTDRPFGLDLLLPQRAPGTGDRKDLLARIPRENLEFMDKLRRELGLPPARPFPTDRIDIMGLGVGGTLVSQMEQVEAICEVKPAIFAGGLGMSPEAVEKCHSAGIKVVSLVGSLKHARRVAEWGVDIIVAQGTEAGGHTGKIGTMVLVPLVVDAVKPIPVVAAGGIGDGRGLVAALALGAMGVWTGTIWLTAHENPLEDFIKNRLVAAQAEDAVITRAHTGKTARSLNSKFIQYWNQPGAPDPLPAPYQSMYLPVPWDVSSENPDRTWEKLGLQDWIGTPAGQVMALIKERKPARQILYDMVSQAIDILES
ncbi:MAG: nitronate monooxygenase [Dehalococcoidia bacterium]|nr:nitronate monooxygenase [Dehalococcoidia bacterium]